MTEIVYLDTVSKNVDGRCCALGFFDAIHEGHIRIIKDTVARAKENGLRSCVQTFSGFMKGRGITTLEERCQILSELQVDELLVLKFDEVKDYSPERYFREIICETLNSKYLFAGFDYSFGIRGSGDIEALSKLSESSGINLTVYDEMTFKDKNGSDIKISTSVIKEALDRGDVELAASLCDGRYFSYSGTVRSGKKLGRTLGFPTINIIIPEDKIVVRRGVYVSKTLINGTVYPSVTNVGRRPTVENALTDLAETYIFGFDENAYGKFATVYLLDFSRDERHFSSASELAEQVDSDKKSALWYHNGDKNMTKKEG